MDRKEVDVRITGLYVSAIMDNRKCAEGVIRLVLYVLVDLEFPLLIKYKFTGMRLTSSQRASNYRIWRQTTWKLSVSTVMFKSKKIQSSCLVTRTSNLEKTVF